MVNARACVGVGAEDVGEVRYSFVSVIETIDEATRSAGPFLFAHARSSTLRGLVLMMVANCGAEEVGTVGSTQVRGREDEQEVMGFLRSMFVWSGCDSFVVFGGSSASCGLSAGVAVVEDEGDTAANTYVCCAWRAAAHSALIVSLRATSLCKPCDYRRHLKQEDQLG
jgi:hypothetical protein